MLERKTQDSWQPSIGMTARSRAGGVVRTLAALAIMGTVAACSDGGSGGGDGAGPLTNITPIPGAAARGTLPNLALSDKIFESVHYYGSGNCAGCHTDTATEDDQRIIFVTDEQGNPRDVSLGTAWESSTMANAARDPYWHAVVASELSLYGDQHADEINDTCSRCHAPMGNDYAKKEGLPLQIFDSGSEEEGNFVRGMVNLDNTSELFNHAMDGVSCSLCHQIADQNLGTLESMTGGFTVVQFPEENIKDRPAYGQYGQNGDIDVGYMRTNADFTPTYSAHISTSETCATCHNLNSESLDRDGTPVPDVGHFPEQAMYTEWLASDYATGGPLEAQCQTCHMPRVDQPVQLSTAGTNVQRDNFAEHSFLGANTVMQSMMRDHAMELGIDPGIDFDTSIERNRLFLQTAAALTLANTTNTNGTLSFDVQIENLTGHKLPSGYHSRRVYLHVVVTDANGEQVYENGAMNPDGSIVGVTEDISPSTWELHHDVITSPTQVQVYQAIMGNSDGDRTHSLLNGLTYLKDNRLLPKGFDKNDANLDPDIAVKGASLGDDDFNSGADTVTYQVPVDSNGAYNVAVELRYQPISFGHLRDLFGRFGELDQVDAFRTIYDGTSLRHEVIATVNQTVAP